MRKLSDGRFYFVAATAAEDSAAGAGPGTAGAAGAAAGGGGIWQFAMQGYMPAPAQGQ